MLKRLIRRIMNWANSTDHTAVNMVGKKIRGSFFPTTSNVVSASGDADVDNFPNGLSFTIHNANGGKVIRVYQYNMQTDKSHNSLYIINDEDDFGAEISRILTVENLKK